MSDFISSISKLYNNYTPQFSNVFNVVIYSDKKNENSEKNSGNDYSSIKDNISNYTLLHAKSVEFGEESLQLKRNYVTKNFTLEQKDGYKRTDDLSIEWDESSTWEVKDFHNDWIRNFYDRDNDYFNSVDDPSTLYKTFYIYVPKDDKKVTCFKFSKVFPINTTNLSLKWTKSPQVTSCKMTYKVTDFSKKEIDYSDYVKSIQ